MERRLTVNAGGVERRAVQSRIACQFETIDSHRQVGSAPSITRIFAGLARFAAQAGRAYARSRLCLAGAV